MADTDFSGNYMESHGSNSGDLHFTGAGRLLSHEKIDDHTLELRTDRPAILRCTVLEDGIVRFRFTPNGWFEKDFSYAIDPAYSPAPCDWTVVEFSDGVAIRTQTLSIRINRQNLKTQITHIATGKILSDDAPGYEFSDNVHAGGEYVRMTKKSPGSEHYYGLGDKSCTLDLRGKRFDLWGSDTYAYGADTDPLYKNIPFYLAINNGQSHGIFFDNSFRTHFDFASSNAGQTVFSAPGGEMNYYFVHAPSPLEVVSGYARLTGVPQMPPMWALGFHQCKWSYYPEANVREITSGFRERQIPCDAIYLDIDYMDGYRCFTWDAERFPDPKGMIADLREEGFKTVVMIDPGLKIDPDYPIWKEGFDNDYYCRRMDGSINKGSVWPGLCHFPDYTREDVRDWWADLYREMMADTGVDGVWNDMNEPAVFEGGTFKDDVRFHYDGHPCSHRKAHNIYGMQMVRATQDGLQRHGGGKRPFAITRSAYAGTQRFSSAWTGDNVASWEHLRMANTQCQRMATSGFSFIGSDIGGFIETPTGELFARWMQLAVFHPFFRVHSSGDHGDQEPWSFGKETEDLVRKAIELRYRLLPTIYTAFWQHVQDGKPMLRSLALIAPERPDTYWRNAEFGFGDHLYIVPICDPWAELQKHAPKGRTGRHLYLAPGAWYHYGSDELHLSEGGEIFVDGDEETIPIFARAGSVLPHWPLQQYIGELENPTPTLHVYAPVEDEAVVSHWYQDAGDGSGHLEGDYRASKLTVSGDAAAFTIEQSHEGSWQPGYSEVEIVIHGLEAPDEVTVQIGNQTLDVAHNQGRLRFLIKPEFDKVKIS